MRHVARAVPIARPVQAYAIRLTLGTHPSSPYATPLVKRYVRYGASPRAAQAMVLAAKIHALNRGQAFVSVDDIRAVALPALRHRILLNFEGEADEVSTDAIVAGAADAASPTGIALAAGALSAMALRFEDDFLKKLEYLHVVSKRAFAGQNRADRLTPKRGRGLEFADHRPYAPGDDFRHIDWKAYKRLNRLLLRLFDEERDLPIYLMLDASRSMAEPAKFDMARRIAAALCYIGLAHLDRLTILPFGARPRRTRRRRAAARDGSSACSSCSSRWRPAGADRSARVVQGVRVAAAADGARR